MLKGQWTGYLLAATGVSIILTGFWGFCPMCALVGRKLDRNLDPNLDRKQGNSKP